MKPRINYTEVYKPFWIEIMDLVIMRISLSYLPVWMYMLPHTTRQMCVCVHEYATKFHNPSSKQGDTIYVSELDHSTIQ